MGRGERPPKAKVGAGSTVTGKSRKADSSTGLQLKQRLAEALAQHAAISEILQVISQSPTDVQPVLDAVAERAARLCEAPLARVLLVDGDVLRLKAEYSLDGAPQAGTVPLLLTRSSISGRAVLDRATIHHDDVVPLLDSEYPGALNARQLGLRAVLSVPLMREGNAYGAIFLWRREPRLFSPEQVALVQTFAQQAAIAIESVRLFNETKEALDQQRASGEVLAAISSSIADTKPVFDKILESCERLFSGTTIGIPVVGADGLLRLSAFHGSGRDQMEPIFPAPVDGTTGAGLSIVKRDIVHFADIEHDSGVPEKALRGCRAVGVKGAIFAPMLWEGKGIGSIFVGRDYVGPFSDNEIALLKTFADQAVIAIENVRLFTELEARTRELTRSVQELKALGEVGQAVSSTLDLETVLSTIVSRAVQLAGMDGGSIWEYDQAREQFYVRATDRLPDELVEVQRTTPIRKGEGALGRLVMTGEPVEIGDIADESTYQSGLREILIRCGYRSVLAVPLLREDHLLGALAVSRITPGGFAPEVVALLKTFATQSALAIQNARLYREIEVKSRELAAASRHKSEFLANMSHELRTPLNAILGFTEILAERMFGEINEKQAEYLGDILQSGHHLLSLINDILDLSKIEAGRMELELSEFNLPSTIESTLTLVRERAVRHGIELGATVDERVGIVRADERKVKQVLLNLLSNALKFTPEGGRIDVRAAVRDGTAEISVTDTGVGISPEDQEAVFEEFRQVGTASKKVEGTGLGLAISRKFIDLHGGRMWVESHVGTGSTFAFTLPLH